MRAADAAEAAETVVPDSDDGAVLVMVLTMAAAAAADDRADDVGEVTGDVGGGFRGGQHEQRPGKTTCELRSIKR